MKHEFLLHGDVVLVLLESLRDDSSLYLGILIVIDVGARQDGGVFCGGMEHRDGYGGIWHSKNSNVLKLQVVGVAEASMGHLQLEPSLRRPEDTHN